MDIEARRQIHDALLSYCRGIDRLEADAVLAAFHPEAEVVDYGPHPTTIEAFVDRALPSLRERFDATQHRISNTAIQFQGSSALVETYVLAFHLESAKTGETGGGEATDRLHTFNGRYIDRFDHRDGRWRIAIRTLRCDWSRVEPVEQTMGGSWPASGRAGSHDPLYDQPSGAATDLPK